MRTRAWLTFVPQIVYELYIPIRSGPAWRSLIVLQSLTVFPYLTLERFLQARGFLIITGTSSPLSRPRISYRNTSSNPTFRYRACPSGELSN
jgi:hypothetical protein